MARSSSYTYDPSTGEWKKSSVENKEPVSEPIKSGSDNLTSSSTDSTSATGSAEKEYNNIEFNTLTGSLNYISTNKTIKLKAGDTVTIQGIGKYLSGDYYVQDVTRSISASGYSHSATLLKTDMGNSLKLKADDTNKKETTPVASTETTPQRTYTVKKGDCLWNIAKQFSGKGSEYTKIFDANTNQIVNPNLIYVGQVLVIP